MAPLQPLAVTSPLRILGLVASPANVPPLDDPAKNDKPKNAATSTRRELGPDELPPHARATTGRPHA